jgi:hypothetical protein
VELTLEGLEENVNESVKKCGCKLCLMKMGRDAKLSGKK